MNRYETSIPRTAFGIAAIALTAITLGLAVILPASLTSERHEARVLAAPHVGRQTISEVAVNPARVDVVGDCDQQMAFDGTRTAMSKRDPSS
jgi:hypothetical protein